MKKHHHKDGMEQMHKVHQSAHKSHMNMHSGREGHGKGFVEGHDVGVGHGDFANLPQGVVMKEYPKPAMAREGMLDDTITGVDEVDRMAGNRRAKYVSHQK
jgi:hypothetical protein|uniref:Uncharacterized protein n=1 Tax=uncultured Caudovirales phage TaxID=2100421 RepID=A0A6J5KV28_9CAUD|nr:hypothetical protein UFOVP88_12 [uncultured Caudovirales phage]